MTTPHATAQPNPETAAPGTQVSIRDALRSLGYRARCVAGGCFDVGDAHSEHYLSAEEALALSAAALDHPARLRDYGQQRGLNWWYTFPAPQASR